MKILDRYILFSVLKTAIATLLICTCLVVAVELFSQMNQIVSNSVSISSLIKLSILGVPKYLMMVASLSFLFAVTFFLSQLQANNEMIIFYNSGISYFRIITPILILAIIVTLLFTLFSESVSIEATIEHDKLSDELFGASSTQDNRNITLTDSEGNYMIHASRYNSDNERIFNVTTVETEIGRIKRRVYADYADYSDGYWTFYKAKVQDIDSLQRVVNSYEADVFPYEKITLEPRLFRNLSGSLSTMPHADAITYLRRMKVLDNDSYNSSLTEYLERIFSALPILILMLISCSMNYKFKKNVFLFSVIQSLCTAVVYYVVQMVASIMAEQGVIHPALSILLPVFTVALLALIIRVIGSKNG